MNKLVVFSGNANPALSKRLVSHLHMPLGKANISCFSDGESSIAITENVRGSDVFIVQSTCAPTNHNIFELLVMADALRRASAGRITAVIPYFGYARQDRRVRSARVPISAKVVADLITTVGIDRVVTVDLHADQIQGFFDIPVDNVYATPELLRDIMAQNYEAPMIVSPDVGGVVRARAFVKLVPESDLAIIDKRRSKANESKVMHVIGDVKDRTCILIDDIVDTAGTLCNAAASLKENGALKVVAYCTHPVLSGNALSNIEHSKLDELIITDTIPLSEAAIKCNKVRQVSLAQMLAETVRRINNEESISAMFGTEDD